MPSRPPGLRFPQAVEEASTYGDFDCARTKFHRLKPVPQGTRFLKILVPADGI